MSLTFQSPQWGSNSKGEKPNWFDSINQCFSPRNGEVILKLQGSHVMTSEYRFSPRNGEVILKYILWEVNYHEKIVSVPAMGK